MSGFISCLCLAGYFSSLVGFAFVSHPIGYCGLLIYNALSVFGYLYFLWGFSWYVLLFSLVYIGGVYVLFVFVSLHNPNVLPIGYSGVYAVAMSFALFFAVSRLFLSPRAAVAESSHYLCGLFEGQAYCVLCVTALVGFSAASVVLSRKGSFFR